MGAIRKRREAEPTETDASAPFLGIANSARGFTWRERLPRESQNLALAISQQHGLPVVDVAERGMRDQEERILLLCVCERR